MLTMTGVFAQIAPPPDATSPYAWFLVIALGAVAYLGVKLLTDKDKQIEKLTTALTATTEALSATTDTIERQGVSVSQGLHDNNAALAQLSQEFRRNGDLIMAFDRRLDQMSSGNGPSRAKPRTT